MKVAAIALHAWLLVAGATLGDEGMWMPRQVPELRSELAAAGMELDLARLTDLAADPLGAVVSLGGCTASLVSPAGLIVTNHHCVTGSLQYNSTPESDLVAHGFLAATREAELPAAPGSFVYVTTGIRDVTGEVLAGPAEEIPDGERARRVERRERELVDSCERPGGRRCRVARFYEGSLFLEITQLEIRDVRLVYAPAAGIGNFGGEVDNWMWPRHTGDFGFLRAYVGPDGQPADRAPENVPYRPRHWLRVATRPVQPGDLVWILGYPGRTYRYQTLAEVEAARRFTMPEFIRLAEDLIAILEQENRRGRRVELANYGRIRGYANTMKKYRGVLLAMESGTVEAQRAERERRVAELVAAGGAPTDPLVALGALTAAKRRSERRDLVLDALPRFGSVLLSQAIELWRLAEERPRPDLEREEEYRDRNRSRLLQGVVRAQRSIEPASDRAGLRYVLRRALELPAGERLAPVDELLAATGRSSDDRRLEAFLDALYAGTRTPDLEVRKAMAEESTAQLAARGDAMIDLARALAPVLAERRERERAHDGAMLRLRPRYLELLGTLAGGRLYPDANGTLRFTYGRVAGYSPRDAVTYGARTTLDGVVAKATGEEPFAAPAALLAAAQAPPPAYVDAALGAVPVDFLSTCDITGGNSGSPTLDVRGELVGLAFDGNWEGVVSDYLFAATAGRTIHVDVAYMRWVMDAVDGAHALLREMGLPVEAAKE